MVDEYGQWDGKNSIVFMPEQAEALGKEYRKNQRVRCKVTKGSKDIGPSIEQSNLLHACFKLVSDNREGPEFSSPDITKLSCKMGIDFRDPRFVLVRPDGGVQLVYRSFKMHGPDGLKGQERITVIQEAFEWLAVAIEKTVDEMVAEAKSQMLRRNMVGA